MGESFVFEQFAAIVEPPGASAGSDPIQEAADLRARAHEEGFALGMQEGNEAARLQNAEAASALASAYAQMDDALADQASAIESRAVELALQLAQKIVGAAIEVEPERVLDSVRGGLRRLAERSHVTLLVNPEDLEIVRGSLDSIKAELGAIERLEVQSERRVGRGGAVLRTAVGEIDASIGGQLERARELCERELDGPRGEEAQA